MHWLTICCSCLFICTQLIDKNTKPGYALVALTSKEQRYILLKCMATIGSVSNPLQKIKKLGKAGRSRWLGITPSVRGVAMNPIDHPMGGGNGKGKGKHQLRIAHHNMPTVTVTVTLHLRVCSVVAESH